MMSDRIIITSDDVASVRIAPTTFPSAAPMQQRGQRFPIAAVLAACAAIGLITVIGVVLATRPAGLSTEQWVAKERVSLGQQLSQDPGVRGWIEGIHPLVTFKKATVKSMRPTRTVDGSDKPGTGGRNISEVELVVTYEWSGPITTNGYTDVRHIVDWNAHKIRGTEFLDTNAAINLDDVDWFGLGIVLGEAIFTAAAGG